MTDKDLIARQAKEIYELRDKLEQEEKNSLHWYGEAERLRNSKSSSVEFNTDNCMNPSVRAVIKDA